MPYNFSRVDSEILYTLKRLNSTGVILHIGAHPDDEDSGLLSYFACKHGFQSYYWSATRGESGQNQRSTHKGHSLGIARTWESQDSEKIIRSKAIFGPFFDFGFSKTSADTLLKWNGIKTLDELDWDNEALTREIVLTIRKYKPDIVVSRWSGTPADFHGHHQATGIATLAAFDAASDPDMYPELEKEGLKPWKPRKLYISQDNSQGDQSVGGTANLVGKYNQEFEDDPEIISINTGEFDPISGCSYQERAFDGYRKHQTQGMNITSRPGDFFYYYLAESKANPSASIEFMDGIDHTLKGLANFLELKDEAFLAYLGNIDQNLLKAQTYYQVNNVNSGIDTLLGELENIRNLIENLKNNVLEGSSSSALIDRLHEKDRAIQSIIFLSLGVRFESSASKLRISPGESVLVDAKLWCSSDAKFEDIDARFSATEDWLTREIPADKLNKDHPTVTFTPIYSKRFEATVPKSAQYSSPYWLRNPSGMKYNLLNIVEPYEGIESDIPHCNFTFKYRGSKLSKSQAIQVLEASNGIVRKIPLRIKPPISIVPHKKNIFAKKSDKDINFEIGVDVIRKHESPEPLDITLFLESNSEFRVTTPAMDLKLLKSGDIVTANFNVIAPGGTNHGRHTLKFSANLNGDRHSKQIVAIQLGDSGMTLPAEANDSNCIKETYIIEDSVVHINVLELKLHEGLKYGYIQGESDNLFSILHAIGVNIEIIHSLRLSEFKSYDLSKFDAIIIAPNAYINNHKLREERKKILDFVYKGGVLIVQYQKYIYADNDFAPFEFKYSMPHDRVTQSYAPVKLLDPNAHVFCSPNQISEVDFDDWVVDRGSYFWHSWDKRYTPLLSCSDSGEPPQNGGLMEARYGRGKYFYVGYSLYRQIENNVLGAFKLLANIMSTPQTLMLLRMEFLNGLRYFSSISPKSKKSLAELMTEEWFEDGDIIQRGGEAEKVLNIVRSGLVELLGKKDGKVEVLSSVEPGNWVGETDFLSNLPTTKTLRAKGVTQILAIKASSFWGLLEHDTQIAKSIINTLAENQSKLEISS